MYDPPKCPHCGAECMIVIDGLICSGCGHHFERPEPTPDEVCEALEEQFPPPHVVFSAADQQFLLQHHISPK